MTFWTDSRRAALKAAVEARLSGYEAALLLGCSRNAAIAKAQREGWQFASDLSRANVLAWERRRVSEARDGADERDEHRRLASLERDWGRVA